MPLNEYAKYMSEVHEPGYDTVLGYMAKNMPHEIDEMIDVVVDTVHLNRLCIDAIKGTGLTVSIVEAPKVCLQAGIFQIGAFPLGVLQKVLV